MNLVNLLAGAQEILNDYYFTFGSIPVEERDSSDTFRKIVEKASKDFNFRMKLLNSPVETLAREGFKLPEGFNVKFVEETEDTIFLPIPPYVGELPEEEKDE